MKITIACVGAIKEKYLREAIAEYSKRLTPFCKLNIVSTAEEKIPAEAPTLLRQQLIAKETQRLAALIPAASYVILLDLAGEQLTSPALAAKIDALTLAGVSHLTFVIGGPLGFAKALRQRADYRLSFSAFTFTHQMIRLLLVEQIYRAFKISRGEKYHY